MPPAIAIPEPSPPPLGAAATIAGVYAMAVLSLLAAICTILPLAGSVLAVFSLALQYPVWSAIPTAAYISETCSYRGSCGESQENTTICNISSILSPWSAINYNITVVAGVTAIGVALAAVVCAYVCLLRMTRARAWSRAVAAASEMPEADRPSMANALGVDLKQRSARRWLFSTPAPADWESLLDHNIVAHFPVYAAKLCYLAFVHWPAWLARAVGRRVCTGRWTRPTTDGDLLDAITCTSLIMLTTNNARAVGGDVAMLTELTFRAPSDLPLRQHDGTSVSGLEIVFDVPRRRILRASLPGHRLCGDVNSKLLSCLVLIVAGYTHAKLHIQAERSAFEIAHTKCTTLEPSSRFVMGLHNGLFFSTTSPGRMHALNGGVEISNICATIQIPLAHKLDKNLRVFPFYDFMWKAHGIVHGLVKKYDLPVNAAALCGNAVLHAAEHHSSSMYFTAEQVSFAFHAPTLVDYLRFDIWATFWDPVMSNFLEPELLSRMSSPFYRELYEQLCTIDPELAEHVVTSCSF